MGKTTGFLEYERQLPQAKDPKDRIKDYNELYLPFEDEDEMTRRKHAARTTQPVPPTAVEHGAHLAWKADATHYRVYKAIILKHALKGAMLPVASFLAPAIAGVLTGSR